MKRVIVLCSLLAIAACAPIAGPPPPPPEPGPVVAPPGARAFTVYFGWNRSWVGASGMAILQQVAAVYRAGGVASVQVTGYTDTTGSVGHNQRLSERRAHRVAGALARMGIPWSVMTITGRNENDLAVPTPPGVREPHNRRVTIIE